MKEQGMTKCESCAEDVGYVAAEGVTVTCSRCVMSRLMRTEAQSEALLARLEPAEVKRLRKARRWTQADLAQVLRLPVTQVSAFERGQALPPEALYRWAQEQA